MFELVLFDFRLNNTNMQVIYGKKDGCIITQYDTDTVQQESLANAKVGARQPCSLKTHFDVK